MSKPKPVVRDTAGMRDSLFDALDAIRAHEISAQEAQAMGKLAAQIMNSVTVEIEFYKHIIKPNSGSTPPSTVLKLGHD